MKYIYKIAVLLVGIAASGFLWYHFTTNATIEELLTENENLKTAITNLSEENQIGYAKVLSQQTRDGTLYSNIRFVITDPEDMTKQVFKQDFEIEGDIIHFDALIVKFGSELVKDGKERAMYLWRRVYGEKMSPEQGFPIEKPFEPSVRYTQLTQKLSLDDSRLFWNEIWELSNDRKRLEGLGVKAIFGSVVYKQLKPGLIYVFKVTSTGSIYPESIPDL